MLLWLDLEMTGLDVEKERIIEVAAIVTDWNFQELDTYETVVYQDQKFLDAMDDWCKEHHGDSGLTASVPHGKKQDQVEEELIKVCEKNFTEPVTLAGNSIGQDRKFLQKYMPEFCKKLHYRMLDVSAWKIVLHQKYNIRFEKMSRHRALDDIRDSIEELKFYMSFLDQAQIQNKQHSQT